MAISFPASPSNGDIYTYNGAKYVYDGVKWVSGGQNNYIVQGEDATLGVTATGNLTAADGTFSGNIEVGETPASPGTPGITIGDGTIEMPFRNEAFAPFLDVGTVQTGYKYCRLNAGSSASSVIDVETADNAAFFRGTKNGSKIVIENDGAVKVGGTLPTSPNITLNADGSGVFQTNVNLGGVLTVNGGGGGSRLYEGSGGFADSLVIDGAPLKGVNGSIVFTANSAEVARFRADGSATFGAGAGASRRVNIEAASASGNALFVYNPTNGSTPDMITIQGGTNAGDTSTRYLNFRRNDGTIVGFVGMNGASAVTYSTNASDYRLKENVVPLPNSVERLKALRPVRFNFIGDPDIFDGFIAHECTDIPKAVLGDKDAIDEKGEIVPQGLDVTRMIPLLTDALQKAFTRIEALEAEVQALKGGTP